MNSQAHKRIVKKLTDELKKLQALADVSAAGLNKGLEATIDELRLQKKILVEKVASLETVNEDLRDELKDATAT